MLKRTIIYGLLIAFLGIEVLAQTKAPAPPKPPQEETPPAMAVPPNYRYDTRGRRDPFINPVPKPPKPEPEVPVVRPPGLKGVLMAEANIAGIVWSREPDMNRAVISAPGGKTYFAHKGESLFDAVVKEIQRDGVVFELRSKDREGKTTTREVLRKVRPTP